MKKWLFLLFLSLPASAYSQVQLVPGQAELSLNNNAGGAPLTGVAFSIPTQVNTITWVISFASPPASSTVELEVSNDNSIWVEADTTDYIGGESKTIYTAAKFVRAVMTAKSGGGAITVSIIGKSSPTSLLTTSVGSLTANSGILTLFNESGSGFTRLNLGGTTSVWPALRAATGGIPTIDFISADNSQFINIAAWQVNPQSGINISTGLGTGYIGFDTRTFLYSPANGKYKMSNYLDTFGVVYEFAGVPTIGACGTTPSVSADSNNTTGTIVVGTANPTSCVLNFNTAASGAWIKAPRCVANVITATAADVRALGVTATTTVLTLTPATAFASTTSIGYHCESSK